MCLFIKEFVKCKKMSIDYVDFSCLSPDKIRSISVCEVTTDELYKDGLPKSGGLRDPLLASPLVAVSAALVLKLGPIVVVISVIMNYHTPSTISAGCPKYFFGCDVSAENVAM